RKPAATIHRRLSHSLGPLRPGVESVRTRLESSCWHRSSQLWMNLQAPALLSPNTSILAAGISAENKNDEFRSPFFDCRCYLLLAVTIQRDGLLNTIVPKIVSEVIEVVGPVNTTMR